MKKVVIYTDGACSNNPGVGGFAAILMYNSFEKIISGGEKLTTNNRMELTAVIKGLSALKEPCEVKLHSDSQYIVDAFTKGWIEDWQKKGWRTSNKSEVKNVDLWLELLSLTKIHNVEFVKVKGHSDVEYNNKCDEIARAEVKKISEEAAFDI